MDRKRALLLGFNNYSGSNALSGCAKDAKDMSELLVRHDDNERNFYCDLATDVRDPSINLKKLKKKIDELFDGAAPCVLFYFAGHARFDVSASKGYFVIPGENGEEELPFDYLLNKANKARENGILSTVIVLDCCGSGTFADLPKIEDTNKVSEIGDGVTILTASGRNEEAVEIGKTGGVFTQYMLNGLRGSAADLRGRVSTASIYSHVDQMLGPKGQRPLYKANVQNFITLRRCHAPIPFETLMALPALFENPGQEIDLDPSFEPDRKNVPKHLRHIPQDKKNVAVFKKLQQLNRHGLVVPVDAEHMYYAAIKSKSCRLTELGKHYHALADLDLLE